MSAAKRRLRFNPYDPSTYPLPNLAGSVSDISLRAIKAGGLADIYQGTWTGPHGPVKIALKAVRVVNGRDERMLRQIGREIRVWNRLSHPNILSIHGLYLGVWVFPAMVSSWCDKGDINDYLASMASHPHISEIRLVSLIHVVRGLEYLHENKVVHADLKGGNVLVSDEGVAKLCDFGLSIIVADHTQSFTSAKGTMRWMAPELLFDNAKYSVQSDIWAFGCLSVEVFTDEVPYHKLTDFRVVHAIEKEESPVQDITLDHLPSHIISSCCQKQPSARPALDALRSRLQLGLLFATLSRGEPYASSLELLTDEVKEVVTTLTSSSLKTAFALLDGHAVPLVVYSPGTLMRLVELHELYTDAADLHTAEASQAIAAAALKALDLDAAEGNRDRHFTINQLLPVIAYAERQKHPAIQRLKTLLAPDLIKEIDACLKSSQEVLGPRALQALNLCISAEKEDTFHDYPGALDTFMTLLGRYSASNDPSGEASCTVADAVLSVWKVDIDEPTDVKHYSLRQLGPVIARARARQQSELAERIESAFAPDDISRRTGSSRSDTPVSAPLTFEHPHVVLSVAYMPDGERIVSGCADRAVRVWDAKTGAIVGSPMNGHSDWVRSVAVSPDGSQIASGSDDNTIRLWNVKTGAEIGRLEGHTNYVYSVAFSPDGARIVSGSRDTTISVWDIASRKTVVGPIQANAYVVWTVAYSPDGLRISSGSSDSSIRLWNAATGDELWRADVPSIVFSVTYSSDGNWIVAGCYDGSVLILDAETGAIVCGPLTGHSDWVQSVAFSPDGTKIASGSDDHTVRLWDAETGKELDVIRGHRKEVYSVAFSPDGKHIASASHDKTVRIWDATGGWKRLE